MNIPNYVIKFGGSSLATGNRIRRVARLVQGDKSVVVVLSAIGHTTDSMEALVHLYRCRELTCGADELKQLFDYYEDLCNDLFGFSYEPAKGILQKYYDNILEMLESPLYATGKKTLLAMGEQLSVHLFICYLEFLGVPCIHLPALEMIQLDAQGLPDERLLKERLQRFFVSVNLSGVVVTEGFICRDASGYVSNLQRGGSDYTASLIGGALHVSEIAIWSDIDGFQNNDPRYVADTCPIRQMNFEEAAELAYFGASIMHPASVEPARKRGIPVRLKNTLQPQDAGTLIMRCQVREAVRAIAAKGNIVRIRVHSARMLQAYGFLRKVFSIFEEHFTPIDVIATSEVSISLTIDDCSRLSKIIAELHQLGSVECFAEQAVICVVGQMAKQKDDVVAEVLKALQNIPVHMISYGGSDNNVTLVVDDKNKQRSLQLLHKKFLTERKERCYV